MLSSDNSNPANALGRRSCLWDLVEDVDFIRLDGGKALAFCELNEVHGEHLTQNERKILEARLTASGIKGYGVD